MVLVLPVPAEAIIRLCPKGALAAATAQDLDEKVALSKSLKYALY